MPADTRVAAVDAHAKTVIVCVPVIYFQVNLDGTPLATVGVTSLCGVSVTAQVTSTVYSNCIYNGVGLTPGKVSTGPFVIVAEALMTNCNSIHGCVNTVVVDMNVDVAVPML